MRLLLLLIITSPLISISAFQVFSGIYSSRISS
nr:MAG TPA: hypothetical protein [Crassvirales sp.]